MTKVYPKAAFPAFVSSDKPRFFPESSTGGRNLSPVVLTVWKKSLLLNCDGFTVFDSKGNLIFRVDNYAASNKAEIRLSLTDSWLVYDGETTVNPRFTATKYVNFLNTKSLAYVSTTGSKKNVAYEIEGSYSHRCCAVLDSNRRRIAELKCKEAVGGVAFGGDVFRLVVQPEIDCAVAMALVVLLDQMFGGSSRRLTS
ncbi:hypothetical protein E3N88_45652 [Mikania micrantha]|uniref:Tubby C-terminal domain-containing protein n=1 Tax=Mikania micrantha TaxID=192012 RepID=A0A5N6L8R1_9ASTR|nr:hypothetical protein E3N88_45652 [Mikania micrantha]